ncbi:hypothetical protein M1N57_00215 [Dehalococcoidales bacterium]|nr:hypothetical protein [Dehalococcoidales bacterium]
MRCKSSFYEILEVTPPVSAVAILNKEKLVKALKECGVITDLAQLRNKVLIIKRIITSPETKERAY